MSPTTTHFDTGACEWDQRPTSVQLAAVSPRLLAQAAFRSADRVLGFSAGTGLLATAIAPQVAHVTALASSGPMLQALREKGFDNITTLQQDIFDGLPECYDAIVNCMVMHHVPDTRAP